MRIRPLAFLLDPTTPDDRTVICDVCHITRHSDERYIGALAVVLALHSVIAGSWFEDRSFLRAVQSSLPDSAVRDRIEELLPFEIPATEVASLYGASGFVVDIVPLALYCTQAVSAHPLLVALARTIEAGGDTDTIASIVGQFAGAVIPREHLVHVNGVEEIVHISEPFAEFAVEQEFR